MEEQPQIVNDPEEERRLTQEFREIDIDGSEKIDREELAEFLAKRGVDEEHRGQIVDELFSKCDTDKDGTVDLSEFVSHYITTKNQLLERESELKQAILEWHSKLKTAKNDLANAKKVHGEVVTGPVGVLEVTVLRAENLGLGLQDESQVVIFQGNKTSSTARNGQGPTPNYGETIRFDVDDDGQPLIVCINDLKGSLQSILETQVAFESIKEPEFPINQEFWLNAKQNDDFAPRILLVINYEQNEVLRCIEEVN